MPRCQRTFRLLGDSVLDAASGDVRWTCPYCPENETYSIVRESDLLHYLALAQTVSYRDFGTPKDATIPVVPLWGLTPECVYEPQERRYDLYLQRGSDPYQARLQIGHEMFHRACSQGKIYHWTHEMLACLFSVRLLQQSGAATYAAQMESEYAKQAAACSEAAMIDADLSRSPYPCGLYGRAYVTGLRLLDRFGWFAVCRLSGTPTATTIADVERRLAAFGPRNDFWEHDSHFRNQK